MRRLREREGVQAKIMRGLAVAVVFGVAAGWMGGQRQAPAVWAQATVPPEGAYKVDKHRRGPREVTPQVDILHVLPGNKYAWENDHANWRVTPAGLQFDCRADWVPTYSSARRQLEFEFDDNGTSNKLTLSLLGPISANPRREALKAWRDCKYVTASPVRPSLVASLQGLPSEPRPVTGELLLTTKDRETYSDPDLWRKDLDLWRCLTDTYPRLEFVRQPSGETERVFVFPDGRFRADVRGGVPYSWIVVTSGCPTAARQLSNDTMQPGPREEPRTGEKILLACYVNGGQIRECKSWWLIRP